ncbi:unnamed protein product, partial [Ectocarpus sp. 13 AM-2016]
GQITHIIVAPVAKSHVLLCKWEQNPTSIGSGVSVSPRCRILVGDLFLESFLPTLADCPRRDALVSHRYAEHHSVIHTRSRTVLLCAVLQFFQRREETTSNSKPTENGSHK